VLAVFAVTLAAGLVVKYGAHRFVAAYLLNVWFIITLGLPVSYQADRIHTSSWPQALAWLIGAGLWVACTLIGWLALGRRTRPQPVAEIPGDISPRQCSSPSTCPTPATSTPRDAGSCSPWQASASPSSSCSWPGCCKDAGSMPTDRPRDTTPLPPSDPGGEGSRETLPKDTEMIATHPMHLRRLRASTDQRQIQPGQLPSRATYRCLSTAEPGTVPGGSLKGTMSEGKPMAG
jgi:hypothetical protein